MGTSHYDLHAYTLPTYLCYTSRHSHLGAKRQAQTVLPPPSPPPLQYEFARSRQRSSRTTYMKFSKIVGNSWHNVLDQLQPGIPGGAIEGRYGREELHTPAAAASTTGYDQLYT